MCMNRILVLSRPVINAGDYLFANKSLENLRWICEDSDIECSHTKLQYESSYLNSFDRIIVAGGPFYDNRFLNKEDVPLFGVMDKIKPPISILSAGWYGEDADDRKVNDYRFNDEAREILAGIVEKGGILSTRDDVSYIVLRNNGFENVRMVGCTSWYDRENMELMSPRYTGKIHRIAVSDQGVTKDKAVWEWKFDALRRLLSFLKERFHGCELFFTFNGGVKTKYSFEYNQKVLSLLEADGISYYDISGSDRGFGLYDSVDLHVGFRVHSHIYCLSKRIPSILVSEDARGSGLNRTIGMWDVPDYEYVNGVKALNRNMIDRLSFYLDELCSSDWRMIDSCYVKMKSVYDSAFVPCVKEACGYGSV